VAVIFHPSPWPKTLQVRNKRPGIILMKGYWFRVQSSGFRVQSSEFRVVK
jgi:hypothetical protein